jgi:DNA processing protein
MPLRHWLQLAMTEGIGPILTQRMIEAAGSVEQACAAGESLLRQVQDIGGARARQVHQALTAAAALVDRELEQTAACGAQVICPDDEVYPVLLRSIPDPPAALYIKGDLEPRDLNALAIVGSRKCSYYGREQAERFAALLAGAGMTVVSGGARGVDSAAHRGALSHPQGRTIAVLGSGIDTPYPVENTSLFEQIAAGRGAVITEYPLGTAPLRQNFPRRNRIISGMSRGVLLVEADERSGGLITARMAGDDHGRTVFAVPGRVDNPLSAGPHRLIRDGAVLAATLEDILEGLAPLPQQASEPLSQAASEAAPNVPEATMSQPRPVALTDRQSLILDQLSSDPLHLDGIIERTSLPAEAVLQDLTLMTLKGAVKRIDGQSYVRAGTRR